MAGTRVALGVLVAVLVCSSFPATHAAYTATVAEASENSEFGLTIKTSERRLSTVLHNGFCMNIQCSYDEQDGRIVSRIVLNRYSKDSASFVEVDSISTATPEPQNSDPAYKVSGSISKNGGQLSADVTGQDICQFTRFECSVEFEQGPEVHVESTGRLPFSEARTDREYLMIVTQFIKQQIQTLNDKLNSKLSVVESKVEEVRGMFANHTLKRSRESFEQGQGKFRQSLDQASQEAKRAIGDLKTTVPGDVQTIKQRLSGALDNLNQNTNTRLAGVESSVQNSLDTIKTTINDDLTNYDRTSTQAFTETLDSAQSIIGDVGKQMGDYNKNVIADLSSVKTNLVSSMARLQGELKQREKDTSASHQTATGKVEKLFVEMFDSAKTGLTGELGEVSKMVDSTSNLMTTDFDTLQSETVKTTSALEKDVTDAVSSLKTDIAGRVNDLDTGVTAKVELLEKTTLASAAAVVDSLKEHQTKTLENVKSLEDSTVNEVAALNNDVNSDLATVTSEVSGEVINLGSKVGEVTTDLTNDLVTATQTATGKLSDLQTKVTGDITALNKKTASLLKTAREGIVDTVKTLSTNIEQRAVEADKNFTANVNQLEQVTSDKITDISNLLVDVLDKIAEQQTGSITTLSTQFSQLLEEVGQKLTASKEKSEQKLNSTSEALDTTLTDLETKLKTSVEKTRDSSQSEASQLEDNSKQLITSLQDDLLARVNQVLKKTSEEISAILKQVEADSSGISTQNTATDTDLTTFVDNTKKIQTDSDSLSQQFNTEKDSLKNIKATLKTVDTELDGLETNSDDSFQLIASNAEDISNRYDSEIAEMNTKLDGLETTRAVGQKTSEEQLSDIQFYLTNTSAAIFRELTTNFDEVDEKTMLNARTLRNYLRPEVCEEGMSFMSSARLRYVIIPRSTEIDFEFLCDAHTDRGGWIVIQRREKGDTNFFLGWDDYKTGFGSLYRDFWIGLEKLHQLTKSGDYELRVDMAWQGRDRFAEYKTFSVGDESTKYQMTLGDFTGTAGDSMADTNGMGFSTVDQDNDNSRRVNCARDNAGGWWYNDCQSANLNGNWRRNDERGVRWNTFSGASKLSRVEMKIRKKKKNL